MIRLQITDNHRDWKPIKDCVFDNQALSGNDFSIVKSDLWRIANKEIKNLTLVENPNLLVFPYDYNQYGDKISESQILSMRGDEISTGNIMGFVGVNQTQIDIKSRFSKECPQDYFLHYMLQKVFCINLFDIKHTTNQEQIFDFLLYLFPYFLKKALAQGVFKKYRRFAYNDANIRGPIDVSRHIRQNIPFKGTVAYSTREHSYDNEVTQLVRHTIEYIKTKEHGRIILGNDSKTKECVSQIIMATPTYNVRERQRVVNQNLRPLRHPYFSAYTNLQKICLQILRHESLKYGQEKDKIYGILFDGAWLWEEYLNTILEKEGFTHPRNRINNVGKHIFINPKKSLVQPDFFIENKIVLDAKYKKHTTLFEDKQREDRFQLLAYMHIFNANVSGLIVPNETISETIRGEIQNGGAMCLFKIKVQHSCQVYGEYVTAMKKNEDDVIKEIIKCVP